MYDNTVMMAVIVNSLTCRFTDLTLNTLLKYFALVTNDQILLFKV